VKSMGSFKPQSLMALLEAGTLAGREDGELLELFRANRADVSAEAFRVLVERHGPLIHAICRRLLRDPNDVDDAFQATFLVLVHRVNSIRKRDSIGAWLHGVAVRVARRARHRAARRMALERTLENAVPVLAAKPDCSVSEVVEAVHQEIDRLPGKYREPVILCCLEQQTYEQAARQLGTSEPTLRGRLHRGRQRLEARLRARGFSSTDALVLVGWEAGPALHPALVDSTVLLAQRFSAVGGLVTAAVTPSVLSLVQGVVHAMFWNPLKVAVFSALVAAGVLGTAVLARQGQSGSEAPAKQKPAHSADNAASPAPTPISKQTEKASIDRKNEPIRFWLSEKLDLDHPTGISLQVFLKEIKKATTTKDNSGIPIYVNPRGQQDAQITTDSKVFVTKGTALGETLRYVLNSIGLSYILNDGFLMIDSRTGILESRLDEVDRKLDRIINALERRNPAP
jgi:RNA polymerase sigma factor (sigma-70 family)